MKTPKWLKVIVFAIAALATLVALAYAIESYRGKRAWARCRAELEARGEVFDWSQLAPKPVPDADNFAMTPLLAPFCDYRVDPKTQAASLRDTNACERVKSLFHWAAGLEAADGNWRLAEAADLAAWQTMLRNATNADDPVPRALASQPPGTPAADVLFLLDQNRVEIGEIRAAARRPHVNFKIRYQDGISVLLPHLSLMKGLARPFRVGALAHLAAGDPAAAAADLQVMFALGEKCGSEPLLIAGLVRLAMIDWALQPLWEGLVRHQWREADLAGFETTLRTVNVVREMQRVLRGERTYCLTAFANAAGGGPPGEMTAPEFRALRAYPSGWLAQNQVNIARVFQRLIEMLDPEGLEVRLDPEALRQIEQDTKRKTPYNIFAALLVPAVVPVVERTAAHQANVTLARVAVALERHRLAHGRFPESLTELAPAYLEAIPPDPVNGQPLVYRIATPDRYTLYSVGLDRKDDGGQVAKDSKGRTTLRKADGDWVWPSQIAR